MKNLLLLSALLASTATYAEATAPINYYKGEVFWISGAVGQASTDSSTGSSNLLSFKFNTGYDFNENFGLYFGASTLRNLDDRNINYIETGMNTYLPINRHWTFNASLGATSTTNGDVTGKLEPKIGVGIAYEITPQFTTQLTYDHLFDVSVLPNIKEDVQQISWGFTYHFGRPSSAATTIQQIKIYK